VDIEGYLVPGSEERALFDRLDLKRLPRHVAIIMDGNGRWARQRGLPRVKGHEEGIDSVREVVECCARLRLEALTLYAFSQENWKRPKTEISTLMSLLKRYITIELPTLMRHGIRFDTIGRIGKLQPAVQRALAHARETTRSNQGMDFQVALNYGGRAEIVDACRRLIADAEAEGRAPEVSEETLSACMYGAGRPDPDLLIRTSGELRVSNFLLWQIAYSEIWVTETLWPDFRRRHLLQALLDYQKRDRRYGAVK
jgi:undecaprenyl diphosphate synthase